MYVILKNYKISTSLVSRVFSLKIVQYITLIVFFKMFQFEVNKKRDTELLKLRKLLEDVHLESEETAHLLKKKHQEIVVDFQDQIDQLTKAKSR